MHILKFIRNTAIQLSATTVLVLLGILFSIAVQHWVTKPILHKRYAVAVENERKELRRFIDFTGPNLFNHPSVKFEISALYYSLNLLDLGEPPLPSIPAPAFRASAHPAFFPTFSFRVQTGTHVAEILFKASSKVSSDGSREFYKSSQSLSKAEALEVAEAFKLHSICNPFSKHQGLDGSTWVLESWNGTRFCAIDPWSSQQNEYRKLMRKLRALSKLENPPDWVSETLDYEIEEVFPF